MSIVQRICPQCETNSDHRSILFSQTAKSKKKGKATLGSVGKAAKRVDIQADAFGDLGDIGMEGDYQNDDFM